MEYGSLIPNSTCNFFPENATTMEGGDHFIEELLFEGCWLETSNAFNFFPDLLDPCSHYIPSQLDVSNSTLLSINPNHQIYQQDHNTEVINNLFDNFTQNESFVVEGNEVGRRLWIGPRAIPGPCSSVKERLILAIGYIKECVKDRDALIQIWVPIKRGGRQVLTTYEEDSAESVGLPSRALLRKLPEWSPPDVGFFRSCEYPRIGYAQQYDVRGSITLPIFERGSGTCLGVVEIAMNAQKINYLPEVEYVGQAIETVDPRNFQDFSLPTIMTFDEFYQAALSEILEVLTSVCKTHRLPLALTWAPCAQQGKGGWRHTDENYTNCVSTVDSACLVADSEILGFHEACSEHHLLRGQGIVGTAFSTCKPCFATDITAFSMTEYPLSHHARMFALCAAVAIPFRSIYTGSLDFVLEFFLPKNCQDSEEQKQMLNSLSIAIQQSCRSLHVVGKEVEEEIMLPTREAVVVADGGHGKEEITQKFESSFEEQPSKESSWIAHMMEAQKQGKGISVSLDYQTEEVKEEFRVTTNWDNSYESLPNGQIFSEFGQLQQNSVARHSVEGGRDSYSFGGRRSSTGRKAGEKRRTKTEKSISLQVLRQYFAGSLKDAAKSIGVCPTTLKRICRQHGITRWPSRKIKKVGHSLRKLQLVIDSVQGTEGSIQIGSFYSSFPELNSPKFQGNGHLSSGNTSDHSRQLNAQQESGFFNHGNNTKSPSSSSSSQTSGSTVSANGRQQYSNNINAFNSGDALMIEDPIGMMKRACSEAEFCTSSQEETKLLPISQSYISLNDNRSFDILPPLTGSNSRNLRDGYAFRVKANLGNEKIRFSLHPNCTFRDLQQEIARRFNLDDISTVEIKYLDDDREWVLLTCNADLQECMEIYKSSQSSTIRLFLQRNSHPNQGNSYGSYSPS